MSKVKVVLVVVLVFVLLTTFSVGTGLLDIKIYQILGQEKASADREIFEENKSHVKGMIDDLADYRYQWQTADSETSKKAILDLVRSKFSDFKLNNINNDDLRLWLDDVLNGRL